jgi:HPt (histidine-containing phosphotransfer) domain-containing protein
MDRKDLLAEDQQDLLEHLVALVSRQTRLLEEIRDLLAAERTPASSRAGHPVIPS